MRRLNIAVSANSDAAPMTAGAVVDFTPSGPHRTIFVMLEPIELKLRVGKITASVTRPDGDPVPLPPPVPAASIAQEWMRAAIVSSDIAKAMSYLPDKASWVDLYKAYEVLLMSGLGKGAVSASSIGPFTHTANTSERRADIKYQSPPNPMSLGEGRAVITQWLAAALRVWPHYGERLLKTDLT